MQTGYGAHEIMELHEVMSASIDGINTVQLYLTHIRDQTLKQMILNQLQFMTEEHNRLVHLVNGRGGGAAVPYRPLNVRSSQTIGIAGQMNTGNYPDVQQLGDRDVSSAILGLHKSSAKMRMSAALECADAEIRSTLIQGATNCANLAYELWTYMNNHGYTQLVSLPEAANAQLLHGYQPLNPLSPVMQMPQHAGFSYQGQGNPVSMHLQNAALDVGIAQPLQASTQAQSQGNLSWNNQAQPAVNPYSITASLQTQAQQQAINPLLGTGTVTQPAVTQPAVNQSSVFPAVSNPASTGPAVQEDQASTGLVQHSVLSANNPLLGSAPTEPADAKNASAIFSSPVYRETQLNSGVDPLDATNAGPNVSTPARTPGRKKNSGQS